MAHDKAIQMLTAAQPRFPGAELASVVGQVIPRLQSHREQAYRARWVRLARSAAWAAPGWARTPAAPASPMVPAASPAWAAACSAATAGCSPGRSQ
ncbi:MAG: hypothetical protein FJ086_00260 [Deltaproteobacteria bacterium]|nr:hypothetical protein [Deltaproteobacteria bacterium]